MNVDVVVVEESKDPYKEAAMIEKVVVVQKEEVNELDNSRVSKKSLS